MRVPSKLKLTTGQINSLRLFIEKTSDKKEYLVPEGMFVRPICKIRKRTRK